MIALSFVLLAGRAAVADESPRVQSVLARAREEVARQVSYDGRYVALAYPGGDVDPSHGVCTDVVIRALRAIGVDLQVLVHEDIRARPAAYARFVRRPDANIDHRRVGPLTVWLDAHAQKLPSEPAAGAYAPGDLVVWSLHGNGVAEHIGLVSDRVGPRGLPLVLHNIGPQPSEDDALDAWRILGHWRL